MLGSDNNKLLGSKGESQHLEVNSLDILIVKIITTNHLT